MLYRVLKHDFRDAVIRISVGPKSDPPVCERSGQSCRSNRRSRHSGRCRYLAPM